MALPVAIQLYSLRDEMEKDFKGTLKAVKEMGYDGVEFAGLYGNDPADVKAMCEEIGLVPISAHVTTDEYICDGVDVALDRWQAVGVKYVVIPYLVDDRRPGAARWKGEDVKNPTYDLIKAVGEGAQARGMHLLYHNHDFEFKNTIDGKYMLEVLYDSFTPEVLASELDTCWVNIGGEVPATYIKKFTGRAPVVHLKDFYMTGSLPKHLYALIGIDEEESEAEEATFEFRPVGHGLQDMPAILAASVEAGAGWVVVEQDDPTPGTTPLECAAKSIAYVKGLEW
ncbi:MAG: sugar phosphate isomerase/epimerase [Clostridia bacterium]|nr:sugar phosphate isomerase/epimerase [Clostridia bacterium]